MTRSKATASASYVADMRFGRAVKEGTRKRRERDAVEQDLIWDHSGVRPVTDPQVAAERERHEADLKLNTSRAVARYLRDRGCTGLYCGEGHDAHREVRGDLLAELGLTPDPLSRGVRNTTTGKPEREGREWL